MRGGPVLVVDNDAGARRDVFTAVCVVSLENVGRLTSLHGSVAAGAAAQEYAARLESVLRDGDQIIAINENKHCLLLRGLRDRNHAELAGLKLERVFGEAFVFQGMQVSLTVRAGIACGHHKVEAEELFRAAEAAREAALSGGRIYEVADEMDVSALHRHWQLNDHLEAAIRQHQIRVYYQPKIRARTRDLAGAEALVRWEHEDGLLAPGQFLPYLDRERMIVLTLHVVRQTIRDLAAGSWMPPASINLEPYMLEEPLVLRTILDELALWSVDPRRLIVEVTESGFVGALDDLCPEFAEIRDLGVRVSIDDFGTGQSSLAQFKMLPLDELKIDRTFITRLDKDDADRYLTHLMIELGHFFGLTVVAEGVESPQVANLLDGLGCDLQQGFLYSPPLPLEEFAAWQAPRTPPTSA